MPASPHRTARADDGRTWRAGRCGLVLALLARSGRVPAACRRAAGPGGGHRRARLPPAPAPGHRGGALGRPGGGRADHGHRGHARPAAHPATAPATASSLTLLADADGQAHFAYLPPEHATLPSGPDLDYRRARRRRRARTVEPGPLRRGRRERRARGWPPPVVTVAGRDDLPDPALYERPGAHRRPARRARQRQARARRWRTASSTSRCATACCSAPWSASPTRRSTAPGRGPPWSSTRATARPNPASEEAGVRLARALRLRHGVGQHAGQRLLGRRVRRVQPGPDGRRLRHDRDRRPPGLGARAARSAWSACRTRASRQLYTAATNPPHLAARHAPVGHRRPVAAGVARRHLQLGLHPAVDQGARRRPPRPGAPAGSPSASTPATPCAAPTRPCATRTSTSRAWSAA